MLINSIVLPGETDDPKILEPSPSKPIPITGDNKQLNPDYYGCDTKTLASIDILERITRTIHNIDDVKDSTNICEYIVKELGQDWICFSNLGGGLNSYNAVPNSYVCFTMNGRTYNVAKMAGLPSRTRMERRKPYQQKRKNRYGRENFEDDDNDVIEVETPHRRHRLGTRILNHFGAKINRFRHRLGLPNFSSE